MGGRQGVRGRASASIRARASRPRTTGSMGEVTGGRLEIKTSGRYTYEMGGASRARTDAGRPGALARLVPVHAGAGARGRVQPRCHRTKDGPDVHRRRALPKAGRPSGVFASPASCRAALEALEPSPEHMFFFEYNFLFVLAAGGRAEKAALGDHSAAGYPSARASTRSAPRPASFSRRAWPATSCSWPRQTGLARRRALRGGPKPPRRASSPTTHSWRKSPDETLHSRRFSPAARTRRASSTTATPRASRSTTTTATCRRSRSPPTTSSRTWRRSGSGATTTSGGRCGPTA